jgi:hypothetical protein
MLQAITSCSRVRWPYEAVVLSAVTARKPARTMLPQKTVLLLAVRCLSPMSRFPLSDPLNEAEQSCNISLTLQYS